MYNDQIQDLLDNVNEYDEPGMDTKPEIVFYESNQGRLQHQEVVSEKLVQWCSWGILLMVAGLFCVACL